MTAYKIGLVTDSTCDIPQHLREQYQIGVVPLTIVWDGEAFLDGVDLTPEGFYARLSKDPNPPTTSQPSPQDFLNACQLMREAGAEQVVIITLSSAMSGTYQSARQAAEQAAYPIHVYDSRTNSMALGWQVLAAARAREDGGDVKEMLAAADQARRRMSFIISLDTIEFLKRGGRIGGAVRFLDSLLRIKPQISVNHETGKVEAGMPARSRDRAIDGVFRDFFHRQDTKRPLHIAVMHNAAEEEALALAARVQAEYNPAELIIQIVSPILGAHTGPRAIALCGYAEE